MGIKTEIEAALQAHALWRKHFKDYLNGRAAFDIETVSSTIECEFGRWLTHEGSRHIPLDLYEQIHAAHAAFHQIAARIIELIKEKNFAAAHGMIAADGALNQASAKLADLLMKAQLHGAGGAGGTSGAPAAESETSAASETPAPPVEPDSKAASQ